MATVLLSYVWPVYFIPNCQASDVQTLASKLIQVRRTQYQPYLAPNTGQKIDTRQMIVELELEGSCGQPHASSQLSDGSSIQK